MASRNSALADEPFEGEVRVASSIVDFLSSGLYESPAACLKELINNAYDADAKRVDVFVKPDANSIMIADDGRGMTRAQFVAHFDRISQSLKRSDSDTTSSGRPKIGLIGIGFVAANELCEEMIIRSTMEGSRELLEVAVDFHKMREPQRLRRSADDTVSKGDYRGVVRSTEPESHYTQVFLNDVRDKAREILVGAHRARGMDEKGRSLYGLTARSVRDRLLSPNLRTWQEFDFYSQTMLGVALNVPIRYHDKWVPSQHQRRVRQFEDACELLDFTVTYDGTDLRKPVVLQPGDDGHILHTFELEGAEVSAKGYLFARHGTLKPEDLNGVLIRIRNSAVGEYRADFLDYPKAINTLIQRWVTGELWADDRLENAMNIDRRTLRSAHSAYAEMQALFHKELDGFLKRVRAELYEKPTEERNAAKAHAEVEKIRKVLKHSAGAGSVPLRQSVSSSTARRVDESWTRKQTDRAALRRLARKYSVAEIYDIVIDAATEVLATEDLDHFLRVLTRRLQG